MDYLKTVVPSQLMAERGANLVVINPGSANVRMGFASQDVPFNILHCIARHKNDGSRLSVRDQRLNCRAGWTHNAEREKSYDIIASLLKIPLLEEVSSSIGNIVCHCNMHSHTKYGHTIKNDAMNTAKNMIISLERHGSS